MVNDDSILYSNFESDKINQMIQTKIAPHLFLACNYAPSSFFIQSEDAKFIVGILNLYKFAVDGSIIDKIPNIMDETMGSTINRREFIKKINLVKALRTVFCHNESEISGNNDDVKIVNLWLEKIPQTINDYKILNQQLQKLASEIVAILYQFINDASRSKRKEVLIENWENIIKNFYQRSNTKNILVGQLKKFYSARKGILSMDRSDNLDMAKCVRKYYIGDIENELKKKEENYRLICRTVSLTAENKSKLKTQIESVEKELIKRKKNIIKRLGNSGITIERIDGNDYLYLDLYMKELPQRIIKIIDDTVDTSVYGNLLPQNIVQYIVKQDFDLIIKK